MVVSRAAWPQIFAAMCGGSPERMASVTKIRRKSCGVNFSPLKPGCTSARARQRRSIIFWIVPTLKTAGTVPFCRWNRNGIGGLQTLSCGS
jgi:hypothetical protein